MSSDDRYKYFRIEAREILDSLGHGVLELEKGNVSKDIIGRMLRHAHTLKGAARIVNQNLISELSHKVEDILAPHRDGNTAVPQDGIRELLRLIDAMAASLGELASQGGTEPAPAQDAPPARPAENPFETVRLEISDMDSFLHETAQAGISVTALKEEATVIDRAMQLTRSLLDQADVGAANSRANRSRLQVEELHSLLRRLRQSLSTAAEKAQSQMGRVQERAGELRLLPASTVFATMQRVARDAGEALGKQVEFHAHGGENRLDAHILRALSDALGHVVRNAVAHGIEPEAQRRAAGKSPRGHVHLRVERRGNRVVFICEDDGRGIDIVQVRRAAIESGLVSAAEAAALDLAGAIDLLLQGGVSTSSTLTSISGRGVGLDVVRQTIANLKGEWNVTTEPSRRTTVTLIVPISLESLSVLEMEVAGTVLSVPFDSVVAGQRITTQEIARSPRGDSILYEGKTLPFLPLASLLRPGSSPSQQAWSVVVVLAESKRVAIGVDRLLGRTTVVMRPLPRLAGQIELVAGASFDSEGNPQLVIDAAALVRAASRQAMIPAAQAARRKLPLLVVDDSLTTRMLEQSILETAGYEVDVAVSGEEALEKAHHKAYAMFVVDVEMPGIDGFEFIERVQSDMQLRHIPAILVTSRASTEDRHRGEQVGARDYIIKSEFDEGHLLRTIRSLVG